jgi:hypothetical protein|tara:strand:- start:27 stop:227 length:201 start_codon:yes stop_codon:yes gene_type:complete
MRYILIVTILLTGCSVMQDKMDEMSLLGQENAKRVIHEYETSPSQLCCVPDPDFPHSCGGWDLCEL